MVYVGHLDIMRYFQKAVRRSGIKAEFSQGFSPHMIMSFAQPLRVGVSSFGEYFDLDLGYSENEIVPSFEEMTDMLNAVMADGIRIESIVSIPEDKKNKCMSLVAASVYSFELPDEELLDHLGEYKKQDRILIVNQTKKSSDEIDIKPMILDIYNKGTRLVLKCRSGSESNLKPELFIRSFAEFAGRKYDPFDYKIQREDTLAYDKKKKRYVPLDNIIA
jgi:radical SAM-linked protein